MLKRLFSTLFSDEAAVPRGLPGARAYAIGDIHGRLDLLEELLGQIDADNRGRGRRRVFLVFLGDLVDRGPSSRGVIDRLIAGPLPGDKTVFLMGNHEEAMSRVLKGDAGVLWNWMKFGGGEAAASYGLDPDRIAHMGEEAAIAAIREAVPAEHRRFLADMGDTFRFGDYLFVHAGIRPGLAVEAQKREDLRWIRDPFLSDRRDHGCIVVHGHTIVGAVEEYGSRIGIDTGAYRTGVLTAIGIEDETRWYLATGQS